MKRALLIGSRTGGLAGVHADVEVMDDALRRLGFSTVTAVERAATADGIVERYRGLIADTRPGDAAVVYYSGHGGRRPNPLAAQDPSLPRWVQYLVPTDHDDRSGGRVRFLLAEELSLLQRELTDRTRNVTVILDCCHAARMSRDGTALPKADERPDPGPDLARRWRALAGAAREADGNPHAVRVVACAPEESAYERWSTALGADHGALTAALVPVLAGPDAARLTWLDVVEVVREAAAAGRSPQRPDVEGPAQRLLFTEATRGGAGVLPVRVVDGCAVLDGAALFGIAPGDVYALAGPGGDAVRPLATASVERIAAGAAVLRLRDDPAELPAGTSAWPVDVALGRRPVAVLPPDAAGRAQLVAALERAARVRPVADPVDVLATVRLDGTCATLLDAGGLPLHAAALPTGSTDRIVADVRALAMAEHVRALPSGTGRDELPADVAVTAVRLLPGGGELPVSSGDHLFVGDLLRVRIDNAAARPRHASVFDVGVAGAVTLLTTSEPDGLTLAPGERYELGHDWAPAGGIRLEWPADVPAEGPRPESFVTVVADARVSRLRSLGQPGVARGGGPGSALDRLLDDVAVGRRDARPAGGNLVRHRVVRLDFLLHPADRPAADEPAFDVDERPDDSFRLVVPPAATPGRIAVRLVDLTVHGDQAFPRGRARVDALAVTPAPPGDRAAVRATTCRLAPAPDGTLPPLHRLTVHEGPVSRFLDLAVWLTADDRGGADLAGLLESAAGAGEVGHAVTTLAGPAAASPAALTATAVLVRAAARLLGRAGSPAVGVYRTTLLPHQGFGAAGSDRHPEADLLRARDVSFAVEVVELDRRDPDR